MDVAHDPAVRLAGVDEGRDQFAAPFAEDAQQRAARFGVRDAVDRERRIDYHRRIAVERHLDQRVAWRLRFQRRGRIEREELPLVDDGQPVAKLIGFFHVVRRHDDGPPLRVQLAQNLPQRETRLGIEADRRLVEEDDARIVRQSAGDHEPLLLAAGELVDLRIHLVGDSEPLEQLLPSACGFGAGNPEVGGVEDEILDDAEAAIGIRPLRHDSDPTPDSGRLGRYVGTGDEGFTRGDPDSRRQDADQRRLSRAVRTQYAEELAVRDAEIERIDGHDSVRRRRRSALPLLHGWCGIDLSQGMGFDGVHQRRKEYPKDQSVTLRRS